MAEDHKQPLSQKPETPSPETAAPAEGQAPAASQPKAAKGPALTPGQQKRRQKSVFQYIAILFGAAFVLLLFTFVMERRQYQLLQEQNEAQIDEAYAKGRYSLCRSLIQNLQSAGLAEYLPKESTTDNDRFSPYDRYQEIYDALY